MRRPSLIALLTLALLLLGRSASAQGEEAAPVEPEGEAAPVEPEVEGEAPDVAPAPTPEDGIEDDEEEDEELPPASLRYLLEDVVIEGNKRTRTHLIRALVPYQPGDVIEPEENELETIEWKIRGTGWFDLVELRLRRGSKRGRVVLVVRVVERNTIVVRELRFGLSEGLRRRMDLTGQVIPYVAFSLADANIGGRGIALGADLVMSQTQQGARLTYAHPRLRESEFGLRSSLMFANARQFFGNEPRISQICDVDGVPDCVREVIAKNAVVFYRRTALTLGTGRGVGSSTYVFLDWMGEHVSMLSRPEAASERRGDQIVPIDFAIEDGKSFVSAFRLGFIYDRRDDPGLPTQGLLIRATSEVASSFFGSSYDFIRTQILARGYVPLEKRHVLRFSGFLGTVFGTAPFFYQFQISDLTDLLPSPALDIVLDRRPAPNLFGTAIAVMRNEEFAARVDVQYDFAIYRARSGGLRGLNLYANLGVLMLADPRDLRIAVPGYSGAAALPIDLTFDLGFMMETTVGVFQFGFSNLLGFIDLRGGR
ncbi:MAG: BamA/TamA family outer membrane protein [Myxococcales bacterium]|nr:BamA/TamA family outer membrane protein [Myxococcales bacterium]